MVCSPLFACSTPNPSFRVSTVTVTVMAVVVTVVVTGVMTKCRISAVGYALSTGTHKDSNDSKKISMSRINESPHVQTEK